ncbi:ribose-phosphate diphosphokinase [Caenimonas koreensis DSM 17982]|uniref:Ribose-phosphate diphosphokinase n=1 Tax=Caenimonas koreensis DSM 17982 TaxID=1121255 RepID=A0A844ATV3_9BURK|nr:ribose-phosphate pyrophosphokinase [Caenimonas koreensis]MRD47910.1 ribose-phosphate diphosphokinase [Caenimonas koreensis DSM 17982]
MLLLTLPGGAALAAALATQLQCSWSPLVVHRFPDGEQLVRIGCDVQGQRVVLVGSLHQPDAKVLSLLFAADAARELGALSVGLLCPYLAYMRQDMRFQPGDAISSKTFARVLSQAVDFLITVDPHLHRWHDLSQIYSIRTRVVPAAEAIAQWIRGHIESPVLVGPDSESRQWVEQVAALAQAPFFVLNKTRHGDRDVTLDAAPRLLLGSHTPVLVDDIISSGATVLAAGHALRAAGSRPPVCIGVHALFAPELQAALLQAGYTQVVTCDTVPHATNGISMAGPLAAALLEMNSG